MRTWSTGTVPILIAVICFAIAVIGHDVAESLGALGLAIRLAAFLVEDRPVNPT